MNYALKKFAIIEPADLQRLAAGGIVVRRGHGILVSVSHPAVHSTGF
jgi:hypothetical protein